MLAELEEDGIVLLKNCIRGYQKLANEDGINSLRIQFRYSTDIEESILDILLCIEFLTQEEGITSIVLVGHFFGGAGSYLCSFYYFRKYCQSSSNLSYSKL